MAPGYFELVGIALRAGRGFDPRDGDRAPRVAVVSESLARKLWKTPAVLGRTIRIAADAWAVVGVVADVPYRSLSDEPQLRTVEMAIRRALGATDACILRLVMRPGLWLLAIGGVAGCLGGVAGAKALHSVFLGLPPIDFTVVVPAATLLAAVVAVAAWLPARRAVSIEPAAALKQQS